MPDEAKYANSSLVRAPFLVLQSQDFALKALPRYQKTIGIFGILMSRVTAFEVFGTLTASELAPLTRQLCFARGLHAEMLLQRHFCNGGPRRLFFRRPKQNESAQLKVIMLSASMNHHPGSTAGSRLTTWRTSESSLVGGNGTNPIVPLLYFSVSVYVDASTLTCTVDNLYQPTGPVLNAGYHLARNDPSLSRRVLPRKATLCVGAKIHLIFSIVQTPIVHHYANAPASSVGAIRKAFFTNFDITACIFIVHAKLRLQTHSLSLYTVAPAGITGNDDRAAMATWFIWHVRSALPFSVYYLKAHITLTI